MDNRMKWITMKEYVDIETGEYISEKKVKKEYTIINKHKEKVKINGNYGYITSRNECRKNRQLELF